MEPANLKTETRYLVTCPFCDEYDHSVTHLMAENTTFGPWYCDKCGKAIRGEVKGGKVFIEKTDQYLIKALTALELPEYTDPIFFIVNDRWHNGDRDDETKQCRYESGTCPTNFLQETIELIYQGEPDPHGLFNYMKSVKRPDEEIMNYSFEDWMNLFDFKKVIPDSHFSGDLAGDSHQ